MDPETVSNIFAVALLIAAAATIVTVAIPSTRAVLAQYAPIVVAVAAIGATAGSLYYSEVANYTPCLYCWYQRIAMYPMAVIVPLALVVRDRGILRSSLALAGIGLAISIYHIQLQLFPDQGSSSCGLTSPCTAKWVDALGFMSIPQMAGIVFGIIVVTSIVGLRCRPSTATHPSNS
ncbi:disulfide bond formation protein B [Ilumatobacter nonamiensis]|uniref:disulfide bond formation protein B n=1 Tax=Ilumatobacter nonamiensis TaxID=467093 RepID=UPI0003494F5D|nr:disulfide bond formation protein B [Ilumatobacter nonamiensis]